ncbi:MAG: TIGR04255 family protein [Rhodospirillales bacterium]|nr:TIGR04255 family protein [Rhodospirillales bacterium]
MAVARLPKKLKKDAILEALVEVRFESNEVEEIIIGRLSDTRKWKAFERKATPVAELPQTVRIQNAAFKFSPLVEFWSPDKRAAVKIGGNVASLHILSPYPGWAEFRKQIGTLLSAMKKAIPGCQVSRLGLRYINALNATDHHIEKMEDLNYRLEVAGKAPAGPVHFQIEKQLSDAMKSALRVAGQEYVQGNIPDGTAAFVDVDVFTPVGYTLPLGPEVSAWFAEAHKREKGEFFALIPPHILNELVEL